MPSTVDSRWRRARLALILITPALLVVVIVMIGAWAILVGLQPAVAGGTEAGLARIGDALALLIVTDAGGAAIAETRGLVVNWGLLAPAAALIPALVAAWFLAGRMLHVIDHANAGVATADDERRTRLQEVVHELRTPLAVMGTNLELAAGGGNEDSATAGYIDAARRAVDRMARTVDDLEGHGKLAVTQVGDPVDLAALASSAVADHAGPGLARGVHVLAGGALPTMVPAVDPAAVRTVIGNFLGNAVRLAPRGSVVTVDWGESGEWAWLAVSDEGPGLAPHLHARAFERGWRGPHDRDRAKADGGAGLGLTIARQLTEAQGGAVTIESEEGGGATLALWLPLGHDAELNAVVAPDRVHPLIQPWRKDLQPA